jgi:hypothetical protein
MRMASSMARQPTTGPDRSVDRGHGREPDSTAIADRAFTTLDVRAAQQGESLKGSPRRDSCAALSEIWYSNTGERL